MINYNGKEYDVPNENFLDIELEFDESNPDAEPTEKVVVLTEEQVKAKIDRVYKNVRKTFEPTMQKLYDDNYKDSIKKFEYPKAINRNDPEVKKKIWLRKISNIYAEKTKDIIAISINKDWLTTEDALLQYDEYKDRYLIASTKSPSKRTKDENLFVREYKDMAKAIGSHLSLLYLVCNKIEQSILNNDNKNIESMLVAASKIDFRNLTNDKIKSIKSRFGIRPKSND